MTEKAISNEYLEILREFREASIDISKKWFWKAYMAGLAWVFLIATSLLLGLWPISQLYLQAKLAEFQAVHATINYARVHHPAEIDAEMRGIQVVIAQWNGWLAYWQHWDEVPLLELYIPDKIRNMKPIE